MIAEIVLSGGEKTLALSLLVLPGILVWAWLLRKLRERGGRVDVSAFAFPDLLLSFFLCGFFALLPLSSWIRNGDEAPVAMAEVAVSPEAEIAGSIVIFLGLIAVTWGSLRYRKVSPAQIFGLRRLPLWRAFLVGALILAATFPLLIVVSSLMQDLLQEAAKEQEVVTYFRKMQQAGNFGSISLIVFAAVFFQPVVEEVLFRGYFYGVFKGWAGALASAIFTATLFATIHMSLAALLPLLVLALVLTVAYEWSGSLWVPISMHMIFNGTQLAIMALFPELTAR